MKIDIAQIKHLNKHTPVIEYCRVLMHNKVPPETRLFVFRTNSDGTTTILLKCTVGPLARMRVKDNHNGTPILERDDRYI